ncbi:hypothetical protein BX666DRAFT_1894212 [Dichotomocladium elegans]|nr:hypothetical protein BX666DRAFT_1894212 [Dichotomocladium elegans]
MNGASITSSPFSSLSFFFFLLPLLLSRALLLIIVLKPSSFSLSFPRSIKPFNDPTTPSTLATFVFRSPQSEYSH